jgi:L-ascorbate metabolism protein UlaG (beta-lactamase superfamily)
MLARAVAVASLALATLQPQGPPAGRDVGAGIPRIRYVANSGMLVETAGRRFLIDAPIRDGIAPYATSSVAERAALEAARPPYDNVDAILITHWHEDHLSAEAVAAHLAASASTLLISSPEVVERVRAAGPSLPESRFRGVLPQPGQSQALDVRGEPVHVLRIRHNPTRRLPEQHVGFLIGGAAPLLHVGDADPKADNFTRLTSLPPVAVACLPFWYVADDANRRMVAAAIKPRSIVAMHVPPRNAEEVGAAIRATTGSAVVAAVPGSPVRLAQP